MRTYIALIVAVDHDGTLTPTELSDTLGVWCESLPSNDRVIDTESDDGVKCRVTIVEAVAAKVANI